MHFFILAGGYGKRANPLSLIKPKPLFPLNGTPLLRLMLQQMHDAGVTRGFVNIHHKPEMIRECIAKSAGFDITLLHEERLSGSKILRESLQEIEDLLLVVNGDTFLEVPVEQMVEKLVQTGADAVLLVRENSDPRYSAIARAGDDFLGIKKGIKGKRFMYTGAALFKRKVVEAIADKSFFATLARHRFKVKTLVYAGIWLDIGDPQSYFHADSQYRAHIGAVGSNSLSPHVTISADSTVKHSILWEKSVITQQSRISNCIVTGDLTLENAAYADKIISARRIYELFS